MRKPARATRLEVANTVQKCLCLDRNVKPIQVGFTAYICFHRNRATQYGKVVYCWYLALWNGGARHRQGFAGTVCDTNPRQQTSSDRCATSH